VRYRALCALLTGGFLGFAGFAGAQAAQAATGSGSLMCVPHEFRPVSRHLNYDVVNGTWSSSLCISATRGGRRSFTVETNATAKGGEPVSYPFIMSGCFWRLCTKRTAFPMTQRQSRHLTVIWRARTHAPGEWNAALDMWFLGKGQQAGTNQQACGGELMAWTTATMPHYPVGGAAGTLLVRTAGYSWYFTTWLTDDDNTRNCVWPYWQWRLADPPKDGRVVVRAGALIAKTRELCQQMHRDELPASDRLDDVEAGFEIWSGGRGLAVSSFRVIR
jgi:hypothetical protein